MKNLEDCYDDLMDKAYNAEYHSYHFKEANQVLRQHFTKQNKRIKELTKDRDFWEQDRNEINEMMTDRFNQQLERIKELEGVLNDLYSRIGTNALANSDVWDKVEELIKPSKK